MAQLRVLSVNAEPQNYGGQSGVGFSVTFEDTGESPIYIPNGSDGVSTSVAFNSSVLREVTYPRCAGTYTIAKLNPGQNYTLYGPDCGTGFYYQIARAGSLVMDFEFNCSTNSEASTNPTDFPNATTISAPFSFP